MRLRKTLPEDIEQTIAFGDVEAVARAVERCEVGAYLRGSYGEPRLMHFPASEEITDFLLARGEDINSYDSYGHTAIHARVSSRCLEQIPLLIARGGGGDINARDTSDKTALYGVVERFPVADVSRMISWGADPLVTADSRIYGKAVPTEYALHRSFLEAPRARGHPPPPVLRGTRRRARGRLPPGDGSVALQVRREWAAGVDLSGGVRRGLGCVVGAVRAVRGGAARGSARAWCGGAARLRRGRDAHAGVSRLWDQLVPDSGQCQTLQGEVIRIAGRVGYEVYDNGGINWDRSFGALLDQYLSVVRSGLPMPPSSVARAEAAVAALKSHSMSHQAVDDITELAVEWVRLNPVLVEMDLLDVERGGEF